MKLRETQT